MPLAVILFTEKPLFVTHKRTNSTVLWHSTSSSVKNATFSNKMMVVVGGTLMLFYAVLIMMLLWQSRHREWLVFPLRE